MCFQLLRGTHQKDRHVLCREDESYALVPTTVRHRDPWQLIRRGNFDELKHEFQHALTRDGWFYIETNPVGFYVTHDDAHEPQDKVRDQPRDLKTQT